MAAQFTVPAVFKAVDKLTAPVKRMQQQIGVFGRTAQVNMKKASISLSQFNNQIASTNKRISGTVGKLGQLGIAFGGLAVARSVIDANVELDAKLQSLQAITGVTGDAFAGFRKEIDSISNSQIIFAGDTAKAFEIVGSAQPILLSNAKNLAKVTDAAITLKKAGLMPMEDSAKALTGTMNQFDLQANQADRVINVLAAGAKEGSANIRELSESMDKVGGVAKSSNMSLEQTAAAVELMSKFNLKGSEAGVSLKATLLRLKSAALGYQSGQFNLNDALNEYNKNLGSISDPIKKAAYEEKIFGKVHILTGQILTQNIGELDRLTNVMTNTSEATKQAQINSASFQSRLEEIQASFKNNIVATGDQGDQMNQLKNIMGLVASNMGKIISTVLIAIKVFAAYKIVTIAAIAAQKALNIIIGVSKFLKFIRVLSIMTKAKGLATAAQWAWNAAITANPVGIIIVGIVALIGIIVLLVKNWDVVKKAMVSFYDKIKSNPILSALAMPIIMVVDKIKTLVKAFKSIKQAFKLGGIAEGFKQLGRSILAFAVSPIKSLLEMISKIPGASKFVQPALDKINSLNEVSKQLNPINDISGANKVSKELVSNFQTENNTIQSVQKEVVNNNTRELITDRKQEKQKTEKSRVDVFLNNRTGGQADAYAEGTNVNVENTGN